MLVYGTIYVANIIWRECSDLHFHLYGSNYTYSWLTIRDLCLICYVAFRAFYSSEYLILS